MNTITFLAGIGWLGLGMYHLIKNRDVAAGVACFILSKMHLDSTP